MEHEESTTKSISLSHFGAKIVRRSREIQDLQKSQNLRQIYHVEMHFQTQYS